MPEHCLTRDIAKGVPIVFEQERNKKSPVFTGLYRNQYESRLFGIDQCTKPFASFG